MSKSDRHYFLTDQFRNPDNAMAHYHTTGQEIIQQVAGKIDAFVAGVGTGGTLMGVGKALREKNEKIRLIAVEPDEAAVLSGQKDLRDHKIAGIGDGFVPEIVNMSVIDQVVRVRSDDAVEMAKNLSTNLGLMVGVSSGANVLASIQVLEEIGRDKRVVTVLPDRAERYFSTDLFLAEETRIRQCSMRCECPFHMNPALVFRS
jgi:cysteine synthase A